MASPRIEYAVLPAGDGPGQDRCFTADGLVVVLDGASAIDPVANPDATEYVDTLGPLLIEQITSTPYISLRDALAEAIRRTARNLALVAGTAPSSTVSVVRWGEEKVDVLVLGDSPVLVLLSDGRQVRIVQHPQDHIASELRHRYRERLANGHGFDEEHRSILMRIQRCEARYRNRPDGFWICEADPRSADFATDAQFSSSTTTCVTVLTDGSEGVLDGPQSWRGLDGTSLLEGLKTLHEAEEHDSNGQVRPRSKRHDDKTIAVMHM